MNENAALPYCRGGNNTGAPKTITRCTTCRPNATRNCGCFSNQARVRIRADSSHQTRGLARASAQQRVCLCLAIRRGSPFSQRAQCALLDKVKTQMECKKDVLERDDDSATMAALFPLWCLGLFFFCLDPKPLLPGLLEAEEEVVNRRQYRPTSQSLTQIARGTCCDLWSRIFLGAEERLAVVWLATDSSPTKRREFQ